MSSLLDEVDGFDYSDESISNSLLGANFTTTQSNDLFYPTHSQSTTSTTTVTQHTFPSTTTTTSATTVTPMGVVLDDSLFRNPTAPAGVTGVPSTIDWSSQPAGIPSFFATLGMDNSGAATAGALTSPVDLAGGAGALPPMPAMPTTVVSNEELESKIIQDSQAAAAASEVAAEESQQGNEGVAAAEEEAAAAQQQEQQQQQQPQKVKLAELARANVGTNYGMPPFASFVRDVKNEKCLKAKKRYMSRDDINEMIDTHYKMLNSWTPYAEDFYRLNYFHSK